MQMRLLTLTTAIATGLAAPAWAQLRATNSLNRHNPADAGAWGRDYTHGGCSFDENAHRDARESSLAELPNEPGMTNH
jgi:hypothetical protein